MKIVHTKPPAAPKLVMFGELATGTVFKWHVDGEYYQLKCGEHHYTELCNGHLHDIGNSRLSIVYPQDVELVVKGPLIP